MVEEAPGRWRSEIPLALRYFRFETPVQEPSFGSQVDWNLSCADFDCGDARRNRMWRIGVETLRRTILSVGPDGTRHSRIFAIWFGLVDGETASRYAREIAADCLPPTVTPYMSSFEVLALAKAGDLAAAERKLEEVWGGMTDLGVDAFWEGFEPGQKGVDQYVFYGRPFGKSLCHAWSTGPVFLLPMLEAERRKASSGVRRQ